MAKPKKLYLCQNCGNQSSNWIGRCPSCGEWNTFVEEIIELEAPKHKRFGSTGEGKKNTKPKQVHNITLSETPRRVMPDPELNRVLGGGLVPGSLILLGGEPGIGKSTLLLQMALQLTGVKILYVSGEESDQQIKMRAERLPYANPDCYILNATSVAHILQEAEELVPDIVIIDSIQTLQNQLLDSAPGSVTQVRECAAEMMRFAKETNTPTFLIGHINKEGALAGPKVLEHMVDTVLQFEGDHNHIYRLLRNIKNRFGSTNELGIYEMAGSGLRPVENPSEVLISQKDSALSGSAISATIEGVRPLLIEVQALVGTSAYPTAQRSSTGYDLRRMGMLLAVLEKRCGFRLATKDVFLNIAGGIKVNDPAIDLAVVCAVLSSSEDIPIDQADCFAAEVGLSGEIRPVTRLESRIAEAQKLGFKRIFVSGYNLKGIEQSNFSIQIVSVKRIDEVFTLLFA